MPLDVPEGLELVRINGDVKPTASVYSVDANGATKILECVPGDDTETRASALADERLGRGCDPRLRSPVSFSKVCFMPESHRGQAESNDFAKNPLCELIEAPRTAMAEVE